MIGYREIRRDDEGGVSGVERMRMREPGEIEFIFTEKGDVRWGELTEFMHLFRGWYLFAAERFGADVSPESLVQNLEEVLDVVDEEELEEVFFRLDREDVHEKDLQITRINKESPLIIWALGILTAATFAAILSGGEVDISRGRFKLKPLGEGIKKLRSAFRRR